MDIRSLFTIFLEILFPSKGRGLGTSSCFDLADLVVCFEPSTSSHAIHSLLPYRNPIVRKSIWQLKYYRNERIVSHLANILHSFLLEELTDLVSFEGFWAPMIIPMPISSVRRSERGYNQCEFLLEYLRKLSSEFDIRTDILSKTRNTPHQTKLNRKERLRNIHGCFSILDPRCIRDRNIILIDDVVTTGSTLSEVRRVLLEAGARKVIAITLAH